MKSPEIVQKLALFEKSLSPLHGIAVDYVKGEIIPPHAHHHHAQLLYATEGVMLIEAEGGRWLVPPNRAVWLVANEEHTVVMRSHVKMRSLLVKEYVVTAEFPQSNCVLNVNSLLKELILASTELSVDYHDDRYSNLLVQLLLEALKQHTSLSLHLPWPQDARYHNICEYLIYHPTDSRTIPEWADEIYVSAKTFQRQFRQLTGLSFGKWRQQAKLLYSLEALSQGVAITEVAFTFGYQSHSAYSAAFKAFFGQRPSEYMNP